MPRYMVNSKLSSKDAIEKAVDFFGEKGLGLEITDRSDCCVNFIGGGGHVDIVTCEGDQTEIELDTREWETQVKEFMREIG
jgi:hypothetical protein